MKKNTTSETPTFPKEVYDNLPEMLTNCVSYYQLDREKDVFLLSALTVASASIPGISGQYSNEILHGNFNSMIIAPAAAGKSPLRHAGILASKIHDEVIELPKIGEFKPLFVIPGNTSPAAIIEHLKSNPQNNGLICETETDTLSQVMKQEWGDYSVILRNSFQHERISLSRKSNYEFIELAMPKLSVLISGTPNQIVSFIDSVENGLFSRFTYYSFSGSAIWKDVTPQLGQEANTYFAKFADIFYEIYLKFSSSNFTFRLQENQWKDFNTRFTPILPELVQICGDDFSGVVKRLGIVAFRIAMVLSSIRQFNTIENDIIVCNNEDFNTALLITDVLLEHAVIIYNRIKNIQVADTTIDKFLKELPHREFKRSEAIHCGLQLHIRERTIDDYLKQLLGMGLLHQPRYGYYKKIDLQTLQTEETSVSID